jgi:L-ascorbate metabolism protein UlaG (beta-lactamase superfamily)
MIKIKYYGHSMWSVSNGSTNIIIDPFADIGYPLVENIIADVVISSHEHSDHNNFKLIVPPFKKITQVGSYIVKDVKVKLLQSNHGRFDGKNLGDNLLSIVEIDDIVLLHCGDIGVMPDEEELKNIPHIDILMIPIGGRFTIDAEQAKTLIELLKPVVVFPMHYRMTPSKVDGIDSIEPFKALFPNAENLGSDNISFSKDKLNTKQRIIILNYE